MPYTFKIFTTAAELPETWNQIVGTHNMMLSKEYLNALETSKPVNMRCVFVGFYSGKDLIGGALFQYLNFSEHQTFQKGEILCSVRNILTRKFTRDVMILGNNMLTGQNGFYFKPSEIPLDRAIILLYDTAKAVQQKFGRSSLIIFKDYQKHFLENFKDRKFRAFFRFSVQPNMILHIKEHWSSFDNYVEDFSKKYKARLKSARKKLEGTEKQEMNIYDIKKNQKEMNLLYQNVVGNAPFNTFFLTEHHFESMKRNLGDQFRVFGYFFSGKLIGFYTLILNNQDIDTYFLGYSKEIQKEKQIYLNMLFDMTEFGISNQFKRIIFGRTALEIKSTIGAEPMEIFGLIKHNSKVINPFVEKIFSSLNPKMEWIQRKPFKNN